MMSTRSHLRRVRAAGFTLLEVMIAVAILSFTLISVYASQGQAIRVAQRAEHEQTAALLARCQMGEIEEEVAREGFPAIDDRGTDECCEDAEVEGFTCEWSIERVELPESSSGLLGGDEEDGMLGGLLGGDDEDESADDPLAALGSGDPSASAGVLDSALGGGMGGGFAEMAISLAYPVLQPAFENDVRRATVRVQWAQGERNVGFDVVQYLVLETPGTGTTTEDEE